MLEEINSQGHLEKSEEEVFTASNKIYKPDGYLNPKGIFWGCNSDQHDACARYIVTSHKDLCQKLEKDSPLYRKVLEAARFARLSNRHVSPPFGQALTKAQITKLTEAGIRIPINLHDSRLAEKLRGMQKAIYKGELDNETLDLIRRFIEQDLYYSCDNDRARADKLFDAISIGLTDAGTRSWPDGYTEEIYRGRYAPTKNIEESFAIQVRHHKHDGASGLQSSSWVTVVPYKELMFNLGYEDDYSPNYNTSEV